MYKSDEHRRLTEDFVKSMKDRKYAESTISRKILDLRGVNTGKMVYESLKGSSAAEKARLLLRDISATSTQSTTTLQWDDRLVVPIGTIVHTQPNGNNADKGYGKYEITKVLNNNDLEIIHLAANNPNRGTIVFNISQMNDYLKSFRWEIVDPTPESTKRIGKKPALKVVVNTGRSSSQNSAPYDIYLENLKTNAGYIYAGPTSNCQLALIGSASALISRLKGKDLILAIKNSVSAVGKRTVLMDIKTQYAKTLEATLPADSFLLNERYKSTNGSDMSIVLINTLKL